MTTNTQPIILPQTQAEPTALGGLMINGVEYRPIPEFSDYFAGIDGRIISKKRNRCHFLKPVKRAQDKRLSGVYLCKAGEKFQRAVYRLVLETFVGPCPANMVGRHLNGNPNDNRLENLAWGSQKENCQDKFRHGTIGRGKKNGMAKLTEQDVIEIRGLVAAGRPRSMVAKQKKVCYSTIGQIVRGEIWTHVN